MVIVAVAAAAAAAEIQLFFCHCQGLKPLCLGLDLHDYHVMLLSELFKRERLCNCIIVDRMPAATAHRSALPSYTYHLVLGSRRTQVFIM